MLLETFSFSYELDNTLKLSREVKTKYKENNFYGGHIAEKLMIKGLFHSILL